MICPKCFEEFARPTDRPTQRFCGSKCAKAWHNLHRDQKKYYIPVGERIVDVASASHIHPHQKLAMAVIELCLHDVKTILVKGERELEEKENLASALRLLLVDVVSLEFWCGVAGWD